MYYNNYINTLPVYLKVMLSDVNNVLGVGSSEEVEKRELLINKWLNGEYLNLINFNYVDNPNTLDPINTYKTLTVYNTIPVQFDFEQTDKDRILIKNVNTHVKVLPLTNEDIDIYRKKLGIYNSYFIINYTAKKITLPFTLLLLHYFKTLGYKKELKIDTMVVDRDFKFYYFSIPKFMYNDIVNLNLFITPIIERINQNEVEFIPLKFYNRIADIASSGKFEDNINMDLLEIVSCFKNYIYKLKREDSKGFRLKKVLKNCLDINKLYIKENTLKKYYNKTNTEDTNLNKTIWNNKKNKYRFNEVYGEYFTILKTGDHINYKNIFGYNYEEDIKSFLP